MKKYKLYILMALAAIGLLSGCQSKQKTDGESDNKEQKEGVNLKPATKKFIELAEKTNRSLPQPLPGGIRLDRVEAISEKEYKYYLTFTKEPEVSADEFQRGSKVAISMGLQNNKGDDLDMFRKEKMTVVYAYYKMDGSLFAEIRIEPAEYVK